MCGPDNFGSTHMGHPVCLGHVFYMNQRKISKKIDEIDRYIDG